MKLFIWKQLDVVTDSYHSSGGLMIIAENLETAKQMLKINRETSYCTEPDSSFKEDPGPFQYFHLEDDLKARIKVTKLSDEISPSAIYDPIKNKGWREVHYELVIPIDQAPDFTFDVPDDQTAQVVVFPNSGCC